MCEPGKAGDFIDAGDNTYGGKYVVNPSGGLESKGHPLGATGIGESCPYPTMITHSKRSSIELGY